MLDYYTGEPSYLNPAKWTTATHPGAFTLNISSWGHPNLRLNMGGSDAAPAKIVHTGTGSREIDELYVGRHSGNAPYTKVIVENTDTIFIDKVYIPLGCELIHVGPAPLVIEEEMHNNGYVRSDAENIVFQVHKELFCEALLENTGTVASRIKYQVIVGRTPELQGASAWVRFWDQYIDGEQSDLSEYWLGRYADWTIYYGYGSWTSEQLETLNEYRAALDFDAFADYAMEILPHTGMLRASGGNNQLHLGIPLKGVRWNPTDGDVRQKSVWQGLDYAMVSGGWGTYANGDSTWREPSRAMERMFFYGREAEDQLSVEQFNEYVNEGHGLVLSVSLNNYVMTNTLDTMLANVVDTSITYIQDSVVVFTTLDTLYYDGQDVWQSYSAFFVDSTSLDTLFFGNFTGDVTNISAHPAGLGVYFDEDLNSQTGCNPYDSNGLQSDEVLYNGQIYTNEAINGGCSNIAYTGASISDSTSYNRWYDHGEGLDNGFYTYHPYYRSSSWIYSLYGDMNYPTQGYHGNTAWEHPDHIWWADSVNLTAIFLQPNGYSDGGYGLQDVEPDLANPAAPTISEATSELYQSFQSEYPESYPLWFENLGNFAGVDIMSPDGNTPMPFPFGFRFLSAGNRMGPFILEFTGTPWVNSEQAYNEMPFHTHVTESAIPNLTPGQSEYGELEIQLTTSPDFSYVYAPDGSLFAGDAWGECLDTSSTIYESLGFDSPTQLCFNYVDGYHWTELLGFTAYQGDDQFSAGFLAEYPELAISANINRWEHISNPLMGYLDLNKVSELYFEENPSAQCIEFAWRTSRGRHYASYNHLPMAERPDWVQDLNITSDPGYGYQTWRRKYFRFGDEIISSEMDYVLNLLYDQYNYQGAENLSELAISIAEDYQDGVIDGNDEAVINYLSSPDINPNKYRQLGRYVKPGTAFWIRNTTSDINGITILPEHASYDFDAWDTTGTAIFVGDLAPHTTLLDFSGQFVPSINDEGMPESNVIADRSAVIAYAYENDSTYFPYIFFSHVFDDDAENGTHQFTEESATEFAGTPFLWTDSTNFRPSNAVKEYAPHNHEPMHAFFPPPPLDGAWIIEPLLIQQTGSQFFDDLGYEPYPRLAIELYDTSGVLSTLKYLGLGDTLWLRDTDYTFPIEGLVYFTNLQGDFNGDGVVSSNDLATMLTTLGCCEEDGCNQFELADINNDGCVTTSDWLAFLGTYGYTLGFDGDWSAANSSVVDGSGMVVSTTHRAEIATVFETQLDAWYTSGLKYDENKNTITGFGQELTLMDNQLKVLASGRNKIRIPSSVINHSGSKRFIISTNEGVFYLDPATLTTSTNNHQASIPYTHGNGNSYLLRGGAELAFWDETIQDNMVANWIQFYSDLDQLYDQTMTNVSPMISQIYEGLFSSNSNTSIIDPNNAKTKMFVDIFSAGPASSMTEFTQGVLADPLWELASERYKQGVDDNREVFTPENIPLAFVTNREEVTQYSTKAAEKDYRSIRSPKVGGVADYFDYYSEVSGAHSPDGSYGNDWGQDIKAYFDAQLYHGVLAGVANMTLREYFRFKLHGPSPKFGVTTNNPNGKRANDEHEESFGPGYDLSGALSNDLNLLTPEATWHPLICNTYAQWDQNILSAFFALFTGETVANHIFADAVPSTPNGIQRRDASSNDFILNSALYTITGSYGPLMYDMNWNGVWDEYDEDILQGLFTHWSSLGDDAAFKPQLELGSYYRPASDALNMAVNVLPTYASRGNTIDASPQFKQVFKLDDPNKNYFVNDVLNWHDCLNYTEYAGIRNAGSTPFTDSRFNGTTNIPFTVGDQMGADIDNVWLDTSTAPANSVGTYNAYSGTVGTAFRLVPSPSFFPTTAGPSRR